MFIRFRSQSALAFRAPVRGLRALCGAMVVVLAGFSLMMPGSGAHAAVSTNAPVAIPAGTFTYQAVGEFLDRGLPVDPPRIQGAVAEGRSIMRRLVSQKEYARCVQAKACKRLDKGFRDLADADKPAVGVSWQDATDYAAWLSRETGQTWRLPNYVEWVRAAAERYREEGELPSDPNDPAVRWLAEYERETARRQGRIKPAQPFGFFGVNSLGLMDVGGNVWEWTNTCFARHTVGILSLPAREDCGVRVLAGAHVAAMPDFIRDPRNGACSIGLPPANLGFRLVRVA